MINIPVEKIIQKISEQTNISEGEIEQKINKKLEELSGLISREGAAHIIANELGVKLMQTEGIIKIKDLLAGMRDVEISCKVLKKYDLRKFENARGQGQVFKFVVGDESGISMGVLWNDKADLEKTFKEGDFLKIKQANVRENNGKLELHLGEGGELEVNPQGLEIEVKNTFSSAERKKISELKEGDENKEIFATVVQVFDPKFFKVDSDGKRIKEEENPQGASYGAVLNIFVDDGSDNIRAVLWKNQILNFLNITEEKLIQIKDAPESFEEYKNNMLGAMIKFIGRTTKNEMFGKLEFVANIVITDVKPEDEMKNLKQKPQEEQKTEEEPQEPQKEQEQQNEQKPQEKKPQEKKQETLDDDDLLLLEDIEDIDDET